MQEPSNPMWLSVTCTSSIAHSYSELCGQAAGYQKCSPDGFIYGQSSIDHLHVGFLFSKRSRLIIHGTLIKNSDRIVVPIGRSLTRAVSQLFTIIMQYQPAST